MRLNLDDTWATGLRLFLEKQLENAAGVNEVEGQAEAIFIAGYLRDLGILRYAEGHELEEVAAIFRRSSLYNLKAFSFHGTLVNKIIGDAENLVVDHSLTNPNRALQALELALACGATASARSLANHVWAPPYASYIAPDSVVCSPGDQHLAYALRELLLGNDKKGLEELALLDHATGLVRHRALLLLALLTGNYSGFISALESYHENFLKRVSQKTVFDDLEDIIDITALAYINLGRAHFPEFVITKYDVFMPAGLGLNT